MCLLPKPPAGAIPSAPPRCASADSAWEVGLVAGIRSGDARAFESLVEQYSGRMLASARRLLRSEEDAADAVQEALLAVLRSPVPFRGQCALGTWLCRIVFNTCWKHFRRPARGREVLFADLLPDLEDPRRAAPGCSSRTEPPYTGLARAETRTQVRTCIDRLPDAYRRVLLLRDIEELDTGQTARRLGLSPGTVRVRLHRARRALRALLEPVLAPEGTDGPA